MSTAFAPLWNWKRTILVVAELCGPQIVGREPAKPGPNRAGWETLETVPVRTKCNLQGRPMGFGLCGSWQQEASPQKDTGQGADLGCERHRQVMKNGGGLPPPAARPQLPAWRRGTCNVGLRQEGKAVELSSSSKDLGMQQAPQTPSPVIHSLHPPFQEAGQKASSLTTSKKQDSRKHVCVWASVRVYKLPHSHVGI